MKFLEAIQKQPYNQRVKLLWISLLGCLCILVALWIILDALGPKQDTGENVLPGITDKIKESQNYWQERFNPQKPQFTN